VNDVEVDSPSSTLFVPNCWYTAYRVTLPPVDGCHEIVALFAVMLVTVGLPGRGQGGANRVGRRRA
jgi:hypothetical protein